MGVGLMKVVRARKAKTVQRTNAAPSCLLTPVSGLLEEALQHHQAGRFDAAVARYREVLVAAPEQPDALHLLGVLALQQGCPDRAVPLIERAIAVRGDSASYYGNLGVALQALERIDEARSALECAVTLDPGHVAALMNLGITLQRLGEHAEAVRRYQALLALVPGHAEARFNLGNAYQSLGQYAAAIGCYREVLAVTPPSGAILASLAVALSASGRTQEALPVFERAAAVAPNDPAALLNLAVALHRGERFREAISAYQRVVALQPAWVEAHQSLGRALQAVERHEDALACFDRALALATDDAALRAGLLQDRAGSFQALDRLEDVVGSLHAASQHAPDDVAILRDLARTLRKIGRSEEALTPARRAATLAPDDADTVRLLGGILRDLGKHEEARLVYRLALELDPNQYEAIEDFCGLLLEQSKPDEAVPWLGRLADARPNRWSHWANLGIAHDLRGAADEAVAAYARSLELEEHAGIRLRHATILPSIIPSREQMLAWRARWGREVAQLQASGFRLDDPKQQHGRVNFFLAYHGLDDRPYQEQLAQLYLSACPSLGWVAPHCRDGAWIAPSQRQNGRIRVGILSRFLSRHTIGKLMHGIVGRLDRSRFEVVVFQCGSNDDEAQRIAGLADRAVWLTGTLDQFREQVADAELDVLFYADIGMDPTTYFLAFSRLAPVQCVTWGHPVTTGIPNMDAFLSADSLEIPGAEEHYSERLIRLNRLPAWYARPTVPAEPASRAALGLPEDATLYVCPQTLFKLHPDFDDAVVEILRRDPRGRLVLIEGISENWKRITLERLATAGPDVVDRVLMLPRLSEQRFFDLVRLADVVVDPFPYGGGNTAYETLAFGTPIVTMPPAFMRGRVVAAAYRQMGIDGPIASTTAEYVELAVAIANDPERRALLSEQILAASGALYEDDAAITEIEAYLAGAVADAELARQAAKVVNLD